MKKSKIMPLEYREKNDSCFLQKQISLKKVLKWSKTETQPLTPFCCIFQKFQYAFFISVNFHIKSGTKLVN